METLLYEDKKVTITNRKIESAQGSVYLAAIRAISIQQNRDPLITDVTQRDEQAGIRLEHRKLFVALAYRAWISKQNDWFSWSL
ncbi:MAG: hypothetical protein K8S97_16070, partial [Anaerolineae bacterium]|nr:hypothetical protein [Anaerolineae bacterium]